MEGFSSLKAIQVIASDGKDVEYKFQEIVRRFDCNGEQIKQLSDSIGSTENTFQQQLENVYGKMNSIEDHMQQMSKLIDSKYDQLSTTIRLSQSLKGNVKLLVLKLLGARRM